MMGEDVTTCYWTVIVSRVNLKFNNYFANLATFGQPKSNQFCCLLPSLSSDAGEDEVVAHGVVVGEGHGGILPAGAALVTDLEVELKIHSLWCIRDTL